MPHSLKMLIGGQWIAGSGGRLPVEDPATEEIVAELPLATAAELDQALQAAAQGFRAWRAVSVYDRAEVIRKAADTMRARAAEIARTLTIEQGKPLTEAETEVRFAADVVAWYAEEGRRAYGRVVPGRNTAARQLVIKEPVGPVAAFTPWNFPATTPARKIGGALAAGCSIILKPSEETPWTAMLLAECFQDAGLPDGALNLVFGNPAEVSEHLIRSPVIRKISFTGSIPVGKHLARLAADGVKRATLELGGHAPVIVFDDVDVEKVAELSALGKLRNAGQVCIAPTRFLVQDSIYARFVNRFAEAMAGYRVGNGLDSGVQVGPLANARRVAAMERFVADAIGKGASLKTGGERIGNRGHFFRPTVLADVPDDAMVLNEEPFGPIAPVVPFRDFDDAIARANGLEFGLAGYAFTTSAERSQRLGDALEVGMLGINHWGVSQPELPFGGVKESGYGEESGIEGLEAFQVTKVVTQI